MSPLKVQFAYFIEDICYPASVLGARAAALGWQVEHALYLDTEDRNAIVERLERSCPDLVAVSFMLFSRDLALEVARAARGLGITVIAGGIHASTCPDDLLNAGCFDGVVVGDGVGIFDELLERHNSLNGGLIQGRMHPDDAPYFQRHFAPRQEEALRQSGLFELFTSLGCPFSCAFCSKSIPKVRRFAISHVVDSLAWAHERYAIHTVDVWDDVFTLQTSRVRALREGLEARGLSLGFHVFVRATSFSDTTAEELARLGVVEAWFGVETASDRLLELLDKRATAADAYRAAQRCRDHDVPFCVYLMAGLPTQTREDYEVTLEFVRRAEPDQIIVSWFMPYPGSRLFDDCVAQGLMPDGWSFERYLLAPPEPDDPPLSRTFVGLKGVDYREALRFQQEVQAWLEARGGEQAGGETD